MNKTFIQVFDEDLAKEMELAGFVKVPFSSDSEKCVFLPNKDIKFDFSKVDRNKIKFSGRINF